jgi:hypothetical protein
LTRQSTKAREPLKIEHGVLLDHGSTHTRCNSADVQAPDQETTATAVRKSWRSFQLSRDASSKCQIVLHGSHTGRSRIPSSAGLYSSGQVSSRSARENDPVCKSRSPEATVDCKKTRNHSPSLGGASNASIQDSKSLRLVDVVALRRRRTPAIGKSAVDLFRSSACGGSRSQKDGFEAHDIGLSCNGCGLWAPAELANVTGVTVDLYVGEQMVV